MKIAIVGLGKMGMQIAERLVENRHEVIALDPNEAAVQAASAKGAHGVSSRQEAVEAFGEERAVIWLMIPAKIVDSELNEWLGILPANSIVVDGGNSDFRDTIKHAKLAAQKNITFVDVGTSGGVLGIKNGFSMMVGGDEHAYHTITPVLDSLAQPRGGHHFFGPSGSGHYVKMVHNAIEYGMMESLAEGYQILHEGPYKDLDLAAVGKVWQQESIISGNLNQLCAEIMDENPHFDGIDGYVAESGEAKWTLQVASEHNIKMPAIQAALDVRIASEKGDISFATKLLAALRNKFGGHHLNKD